MQETVSNIAYELYPFQKVVFQIIGTTWKKQFAVGKCHEAQNTNQYVIFLQIMLHTHDILIHPATNGSDSHVVQCNSPVSLWSIGACVINLAVWIHCKASAVSLTDNWG